MDLKYVALLLTVVVLVAGVLIGISQCRRSDPQTITLVDTVYVDKERIVEHTTVKYVTLKDTFYIKGDTVTDTVWLKELPIEHKEYADTIISDSTRSVIRALYSGFNPSLDSLYIQTEITQQRAYKQPLKRFGWNITGGLYGGYGLGVNGLGPQVGVGI